jgi:bifunctional non-homologous end joining protein LigD
MSSRESTEVCGQRITSPDRPMYPALGVTKRDLARYYEQVARFMLPHVAGRPLSLVRCAKGVTRADALRSECSFLKHAPEWHRWASPALTRLAIPEQKKVGEYLIANSGEALVALVQGDIVEIHAWGSRAADVERPDCVVFDLDPGPGVAWKEVVRAAHVVREALESVHLRAWPKLTGGKGVHLVVPIQPEFVWARVYAAAELIARSIARREPGRFTTDFGKEQRQRRILIDYKRNHRTATSVVPYSTRARPDATVAVPVRWDELTRFGSSSAFTLRTVLQRMRRLRSDPWQDFWSCEQSLRPRDS